MLFIFVCAQMCLVKVWQVSAMCMNLYRGRVPGRKDGRGGG